MTGLYCLVKLKSVRSRLVNTLRSDGLIASALFRKSTFDRQFADFGMKLFDFGLVSFRFPDLIREHAR